MGQQEKSSWAGQFLQHRPCASWRAKHRTIRLEVPGWRSGEPGEELFSDSSSVPSSLLLCILLHLTSHIPPLPPTPKLGPGPRCPLDSRGLSDCPPFLRAFHSPRGSGPGPRLGGSLAKEKGIQGESPGQKPEFYSSSWPGHLIPEPQFLPGRGRLDQWSLRPLTVCDSQAPSQLDQLKVSLFRDCIAGGRTWAQEAAASRAAGLLLGPCRRPLSRSWMPSRYARHLSAHPLCLSSSQAAGFEFPHLRLPVSAWSPESSQRIAVWPGVLSALRQLHPRLCSQPTFPFSPGPSRSLSPLTSKC